MNALGLLVLDGCEIFNDARTYYRLECQLGPISISKMSPPCEALDIDICGPWTPTPNDEGLVEVPYDSPFPYDADFPYNGGWSQLDFDEDPPWYDANVAASAEFVGFWVESFEFPSVVSRSAYPRSGPLGGSTIGKVNRTQREMPIEVTLIGESDAGLRWGLDWLAAKLTGCSDCADMTAMIRLSCTDQSHPTEGLWQLRRVALLDPIDDDGSPFNRNGCVMRQVTLTLVAGDPCRYKCAEVIIDGESFDASPGSGDECISAVDFICPDEVDGYRICGEVDPPGVVSSVDVNVLIEAGAEGMAPLRIRGALNPLDLDCADPRLQLCMEMTVGGLGPYEKLLVDSSNRRVWWAGPSSGFAWRDGIEYLLLSQNEAPEFLTVTGCDPAWVWITPAAFCNLSDLTTVTVQGIERVCT